jgi:hypothetical protein
MAERAQERPPSQSPLGYVWLSATKPKAKDGLWKIADRRQAIFMRQELSFAEAIIAAKAKFGIP